MEDTFYGEEDTEQDNLEGVNFFNFSGKNKPIQRRTKIKRNSDIRPSQALSALKFSGGIHNVIISKKDSSIRNKSLRRADEFFSSNQPHSRGKYQGNKSHLRPLKGFNLNQNEEITGGPKIIIDDYKLYSLKHKFGKPSNDNTLSMLQKLNIKKMILKQDDIENNKGNFCEIAQYLKLKKSMLVERYIRRNCSMEGQRDSNIFKAKYSRKGPLFGQKSLSRDSPSKREIIKNNQHYTKISNSPLRPRRKVNSYSSGVEFQIPSLKSSPSVKEQRNRLYFPKGSSASCMEYLNNSEIKDPYQALGQSNSPIKSRKHHHLPAIITEKRSLIREILNKSVKNRKRGNLSQDLYHS
ncbi:unnamed protein product [Moneuplotes crassus]|uniref:Uncharacterized protein n=1 Tax=Euplotes crassus TaxID=5936 RepID=A0AAD1UKG7_EUPCR|nr:unnamed protein product [Moneuplotes crassus]